jgi:hypothetical protein
VSGTDKSETELKVTICKGNKANCGIHPIKSTLKDVFILLSFTLSEKINSAEVATKLN